MLVDDEMARHRSAIRPGFERADTRRQRFGKHRHDLIGEIDAVAAPPRLAVEVAVGADIIADIGDRDDRPETALVAGLLVGEGPDGVVMVARVERVDRDDPDRKNTRLKYSH